MGAASFSLSAAAAVFERDLRIFFSYRLRTLSQLGGVITSIAIFHYISGLIAVGAFDSSEQYFAFVVTGLLTAFVLHSALAVPIALRQELLTGTFERIMVSPFGVTGSVLASFLFPMVFAVAIATAGFLAASLIFSYPIVWSTAALAIPVALLGAFSFAALGLFMTASIVLFKQAPGVGLVLALLSLTAGVYFPVALLPGWLEWIASVQPFTPTIDLLRHLLLGTSTDDSALIALAKLIGFFAVLAPLGYLTLRAAVGRARRRGTVLEY